MEADPRHSELIVKGLGLEAAKLSRVPGAKIAVRKAKDGTRASDENSKEEETAQSQIWPLRSIFPFHIDLIFIS